ncbi:protein lava lamp [Lucilia cuprina]|uniref:protein lava lamp n=1 Tax=Lucilia cuprina TaxID=7375 RepID=UPI001F06D269|nr:protein lava lamp [Lucilia cuprina]
MSSDTNEQQQQLQESFLQQQEKISALKELVRKSGAAHGSSKSAAQEKVKNIAERLLKSKAKSKQGLNVSTYTTTETPTAELSFVAQDQANMLSISQGQFPLQSPTPNFASTPNPTPNPTPSKPSTTHIAKTPSIPYSLQSSEKIALMRQQLEQNKLRMAQKASSKQHLEQLVSQLKDKFESTQQCLEDTTELGRSMSDLSNLVHYTPVTRERHKSATDLSSQNFSLEKERIKFLENRCRLLEKQLDKEKQNNQRNNSANVSSNTNELEVKISDLELSLQEKEKEFAAKETSYKEELKKLQNSREITDFEASEENAKLLKENEELKLQIEKISKENNQQDLQQQIDLLNQENTQLKQQLETLSKQLEVFTSDTTEENSTAQLQSEIEELKKQLETFKSKESAETLDILNENHLLKQETETQLKRIQELNEINDVLETTRCDLTSKCTELEEQVKHLQADVIVAQEKLRLSEEKCAELEHNNKNSQTTSSSSAVTSSTDIDSQVKAEMAKQIQELMDELLEVKTENSKLKETLNEQEKLEINDSSIAEKLASLEACIEAQREDLLKSQESQKKYEEELMEKTIELNVLNANFKVLEEKLENSSKSKQLFSSSSSSNQDSNNPELEMENQQLKQKLDESNKAMIKLKLKCKQTEKQIEKLKKGSDLHAEVVKLNKEKDKLQQKITELEDEKGQWQLTQMETSQNSTKEEIAPKEDLHKKCEEKIEKLETLVKEKEVLLESLKQGEQSRVTSELSEIQLEEQVKELTEELTALRKDLEINEQKLQESLETNEKINKQKDELDKKLEHYLNENIELLDKVEKLSKSSSSAESIEIVERLTQQEKQELEEFNKRLGDSSEETTSHKEAVNELTQTEISPEITESLNKLREESSELMNKIELFTTERREVLEKMELLTTENHELLQRIEDLKQEKKDLETKYTQQVENYDELQTKLNNVTKEKEALNLQMQDFKNQKAQLSQELTSLQQSSEVVAALDNGETLFEKCEKSLSKLYGELEAYRKANDKKSKFNVSKKLAKEAENAHSQLSELLQKVKEASSAVETVTVVETVVAVTAPNGKALAEYEQLTAQNRELKATIQELRRLLDEARDQQEDQSDNRFSEERQAIQNEEDKELSNETNIKLQQSLQQIEEYETQLSELQSRVEDLTRELYEARTGLDEKSTEITELNAEVASLKKVAEDFDRTINDKEMTHEKQVEQLTRLRKQLEAKCDTYEQEMEILQTLVNEQKQQLIEAFKEHEHEMNLKLLELQQHEEKAHELKQELAQLKQTSALQGTELTQDLQKECEKLKESLKINKHLVQQQVEELSNKQETIDTLNQQIIDLYKTMEENANKIIEKEDEISYLQELLENNKQQMARLEQTYSELQKQHQDLVLVNQQQTEQLNQQLEQLSSLTTWQQKVKDLEQRNKEQLDKLKKYAANLKKKAQQCLDYEGKLKLLETQAQTNNNAEEVELLNRKNVQLQDELQKSQQLMQEKSQELDNIVSVKLSLEQRVQQLQQELNKKELALEEVQQQTSLEIQSMQDELLLLREQMKEKMQEIEEFKQTLTDKDSETQKLQKEVQLAAVHSVDTSEIEQLRSDLQTAQLNLQQLQEKSAAELGAAQAAIQKLEADLQTAQQNSSFTSDWGDFNETDQLKEELQCTQENLKLKVKEIEELRQSLMAAQEQLTDWGNESSVKNADYENLNKVLQDKTAKLERAENTMEELENELMTLREKDYENSQKISDLTKELESARLSTQQIPQNNELENKLQVLTEELKAKSLKFEKSKAVIKERNGQIQRLQAQLKDLQEKLTTCPEEEILSPTTQHQLDASIQQPVREELEALQDAYNKLNEKYNSEKANFQETITRLETLHDGIQAKLQEDMSYIETLEQENNTFKEKICRLQECVSGFEERRASMERKVNIMDEQLQTKAEEHLKVEDELVYRLNMLSEHDEVIAQRLLDSQSEKEVIEENYRKLQTDYNQMQAQYQKLEKEFNEFKSTASDNYDQELNTLREQLTKAEADMERQKAVYDGKLAAKVTELDELECELSEQLDKINAEKRQLSEQLERMTDDCAVHQNEILRLQENLNTLEQAKSELERESSWLRMQTENSQQDLYELQELRMQSMQDKTEIENLRHQIDTLSSNHESELQALRTQIAELDTLRMQVGQNQTDDQVFIETENKRLTDLLAEKESIIENYQRQNLQLQMAAAAASSTTSNQQDPFALAFGLPAQNATNNQLPTSDNNSNEIERLNQEVQDKNQLIYRLQQDLNNLQAEFNVVNDANQEMQSQLTERQQDAVNLQTLQSVASALTESQPTDVIPAPPMFFTADTAVRSPFDDLIQASHTAESANEISLEQPPTIEDLQRNVSDLEKHAQDLEHKLATRNQRESEYEDKLRDLEARYQERDQQLQHSQSELQKIQAELAQLQQHQAELLAQQHELHELRNQVGSLESLLHNKDQEITRIKREQQNEEHLRKTMPTLESQIVPTFQDPKIQPTLDMFFGNSAPAPEFEVFTLPQQSTEPVVEEIIVPKKAYLCHPEEKSQPAAQETPITTLDLGEDWGDSWGNTEATAEAEHFAKLTASTTSSAPVSLVPREQQLELQMQDLNERLQELQLSLERSEEQKKELHVKSGKLMKKLKEYKVKIDELQSVAQNKDYRKSASIESNSMFDDLVQEELKSQIKTLETQLEEQKKHQESFTLEKEKLLKRIDVLTAGNERMSEMKERQDMEVQMYQARIRELQDKLNTLDDWGNEDNTPKDAPKQLVDEIKHEEAEKTHNISPNDLTELQKQISALTLEVQDLTGDRLELQALLEEEKMNSTKAEQTVASLRLQVQTLEEAKLTEQSAETYKLNNLKLDLQNLQETYNTLLSNKEKLEAEYKIQTETLSLSQANEKRLQAEVDTLLQEVETLRDTLNNTKQSLIDLEAELSLLKEQKEKQIDEVSSKEKKLSIDLMKQEIELLLTQKQTIEEQANQLLKENEALKLTQKPSVDIQTLEEKLQSLTAENEYLKSTSNSSSNNEELAAMLQEKESEILHLKQRINDLMNEDQTEKLVLEILTKNQEIHMLKMQVKHLEDDKHELENNLSLQITKEMQANKEETQIIQQDDKRVQELEAHIKAMQEEKTHMEEELQVLNNHVLESLQLEDKMKALTLELDTKNIEISELRKTVESLKSTGETSKPEAASVDFVALNSQWEAIVEQRCGEIAKMWQEHLAQRERDFKASEERLKEEILALRNNQAANLTIETGPQVISVETTSSSTTATESTTASGTTSAEASQDGTPLRLRSEDPDSIIEKMQAALESQEVEIVTLKEQLAIRSAEYARLAAQYDPFKLRDTSSHSSVTAFSENRRPAAVEAPMVSKSELDLAMYMLHQRDMRCEEMTLEIVNLLAERDTLQLKLSNTLRQLEAKNTQTGGLTEATAATGAATSSPSENAANTSVAGSTVGIVAEDDLNEKLSQLQTVSHSKDKIIKEEREQRIRQIEKLQQDVAKMPPAAVSELIGSDLSQTNQSPSTVLLNWLWGSKSGNTGGSPSGF